MEEFTIKFTTEVEFKLLIPFTVNDKMYSVQKKLEEIEMQKIKIITEKNGMSIDDVIEIIEQNILNSETENKK